VLHIGVNYRYGVPLDHALQVRSRPEANPAPYFVDTKRFQVSSSNHVGGELYYRKGAALFGTEFNWHMMKSDTTHNPVFFGGEAFLAYVFTKEVRPYQAETGIFSFLKVRKSVFKGGIGAWEAVLRFSSLNLNSGMIKGGAFWRLTPGINWYLSDNVRLVVEYGYGVLNKNDQKGVTQFFQSRVLFLL